MLWRPVNTLPVMPKNPRIPDLSATHQPHDGEESVAISPPICEALTLISSVVSSLALVA